jgi:phenylalanyl-tRNA synthetase alpha chain
MATEPVLSPHEGAVLLAFSEPGEELELDQIAGRSEITLAQARSAVERLKMRSALVQTAERAAASLSLSQAGRDYARSKSPELRLLEALAAGGPLPVRAVQSLPGLEPAEAGAAFGALKQQGALELDQGLVTLVAPSALADWEKRQRLLERVARAGEVALDDLSAEERAWLDLRRLKRLFQFKETSLRTYQLTPAGEQLRAQATAARQELGRLTPAMLQDGSWRGRRFRPYHVGLPPRLVTGGRNPYRRFLDRTKQTLLGLGFQEMRGSLVENEFWNMDALFMPQFHPAREIHDVYFVAAPTHAQEIPAPYLANVAAAHQGQLAGARGWGYLFDRDRARRLILRSQGTALSARQLAARPAIPGKYFSMARCFRYDTVDATHAPDFIQIEGIVLSAEVTLRHLLGILALFARQIAQAQEFKAVPDYYPFTEPSVQMHMRHPALGWIELGGAGIFRPEVTLPLGIEVPVLAWGLGLDRMAMVALGIADIRHLFTNNLSRGLADNRGFSVKWSD